jgi:hypothetical protein
MQKHSVIGDGIDYNLVNVVNAADLRQDTVESSLVSEFPAPILRKWLPLRISSRGQVIGRTGKKRMISEVGTRYVAHG